MDTLTIFNGKKVVDRLHGYISFPKEYESINNNLYVELDSAPHDLREGFFAQVSLIKWFEFFTKLIKELYNQMYNCKRWLAIFSSRITFHEIM